MTALPLGDQQQDPAATFDGIHVSPPPLGSFTEPAAYFSEPLYDLELRVAFGKSWVFVGDLSQLQSPGDFITETIGREPIVVVRGRDGALRAFSNVCPHRASTLVEGTGNCGRRIVCPYHGWAFEHDGRLVGIPRQRGFSDPVDRYANRLREVTVDVWSQFVFVNVSGDAPPLLEWMHPLPDQLGGHNLDTATRTYVLDDEVEANWKVMMDNALCDYHLEFVHARSLGRYADPASLREDVWDYTGRLMTRWSEEQLATSDVLPQLTGDEAAGAIAYSVFPNWFIAAFPNGGCSVMWWSPLALDRSRARVWNYSPDPGADLRSDFEMLKMVQAEDYAICEQVQKGLQSRFYSPGPKHYLETRIGGFQSRLMTMLAEAIASGEAC